MEDPGLEEGPLLQKLRKSRRRFQRRMQQLIEKYNQPFEDDPLVDMATLTYQTPQGLKIWGGKLIKEGGEGLIQDSPEKPEDRIEGPRHAAAQDPGSHYAGAASDAGRPVAGALVPAAPRSPLESELRRKYLTRVEALLQDAGCFQGAEKRGAVDTPRSLVPSLALPATPVPGCCGHVSAESPGDPSCPCPADLATAPRNDSPSLLGTSSSSCLNSQTSEAIDICDVTISDLYAGMLHSMSRLLSAKPSSIISTKTFIVQSRSSRRRHARRAGARMSQPHSGGGRRSQRERPAPSEPGQDMGPLRDCKNLVHITRHKPGLKLDKAVLAGDKAQMLKLDSGWKELQVTPCKHSSLTSLDLNIVHHPDQENRLMMLKWLISPVKIVSRPRMPPLQAENRYREIEVRFNKLHQECCPSPGKPSRPDGLRGSWAVDLYRGGPVSPGDLRGLETHGWSLPSSRAKAKRLREAFESLGESVEGGRGAPEGQPLPKDSPSHGHDRSWQTSGLFQGHNSGTFRKSLSPSQTISVPRIEPLGCGRRRYSEIKEKFDQLHQECCRTSPRQAKAPAHLGVPPGKASVQVQLQTQELFGKSNRDSLLQKWSPSPHWHARSSQGSPAAKAHPSAHSARVAGTHPQFPTKRRRLSDPPVCGHQASLQDASEVDGADPRPGEQGDPAQAGW